MIHALPAVSAVAIVAVGCVLTANAIPTLTHLTAMNLQLRLDPRTLSMVTLAHHAPALHAPDLETALGTLRRHGLRVSASRRQVLEALYADRAPAHRRATGR